MKDGKLRHINNASIVIKESCDTATEYSAMLHTSALNPASFNPGIRTETGKIAELLQNIKDDGRIIQEIHVLHCPPRYIYMVADGHRRLQCAKLLGIEKVRCRVHTEGTVEELWVRLNRDTRKITPYEWMVAWLESGERVTPKPHMLSTIRMALDIFGGKEGLRKYLVDTETSPTSIVGAVESVYAHISGYPRLQPAPSRKEIGVWMIEQGTLRASIDKLAEYNQEERSKKAVKGLSVAKFLKRHISNRAVI